MKYIYARLQQHTTTKEKYIGRKCGVGYTVCAKKYAPLSSSGDAVLLSNRHDD